MSSAADKRVHRKGSSEGTVDANPSWTALYRILCDCAPLYLIENGQSSKRGKEQK